MFCSLSLSGFALLCFADWILLSDIAICKHLCAAAIVLLMSLQSDDWCWHHRLNGPTAGNDDLDKKSVLVSFDTLEAKI